MKKLFIIAAFLMCLTATSCKNRQVVSEPAVVEEAVDTVAVADTVAVEIVAE